MPDKKKKKTPSPLEKSVKSVARTISKTFHTKKKILKKLTIGFEIEFFILDKKGRIVNEADLLLKKINKKDRDPGSEITYEIGKNMIEVGSYPHENSVDTLWALIKNIKSLLYTAEEEGLMICPLGVYPGKQNPKMRTNAHYKSKEKIFGKTRFKNAGRACGFHIHFELPWGVFDSRKLELKHLVNSKNKEALVNAYNFLIAADPALTTFMQSSPFVQGKHLGKDGRMLIYRGSPELKNPDSLYANYPGFGGLPSYKHTGTNIIDLGKEKFKNWLKILKDAGIKNGEMPKYKSSLETNWTPVKVNPHGTLEQRGMDSNHLLIILAISVVLKRILSAIQDEHYNVKPSDLAIKEPFKLENKTILIPPDIYVKSELQTASAYQGLENETLWYYCKRLLWLAKLIDKKADNSIFENLEKMIESKKTVSDEIITRAEELGHKVLKKELSPDIAAQIAIEHSKKLFQEIVIAEKYAEKNK